MSSELVCLRKLSDSFLASDCYHVCVSLFVSLSVYWTYWIIGILAGGPLCCASLFEERNIYLILRRETSAMKS